MDFDSENSCKVGLRLVFSTFRFKKQESVT